MWKGTRNPGFPPLPPPADPAPSAPQPISSTGLVGSSPFSSPGEVAAARQAAGPMWGGRTVPLLRVWRLWPAGTLARRPLNYKDPSLAGSNSPQCWNCGRRGSPVRGNGFFCPQCRALQPPDSTRDYFSLMDWYGGRFRETRRGVGDAGNDGRKGRARPARPGEGGTR